MTRRSTGLAQAALIGTRIPTDATDLREFSGQCPCPNCVICLSSNTTTSWGIPHPDYSGEV